MMTFNDLHKDLSCDCLADNSIAENTFDTFARRVRDAPPSLNDFASNYEKGHPTRQDDCEYLCKHRGVSINKVKDEYSEISLRSNWFAAVQFKPRSPRMYCKFSLKKDTGKVWNKTSKSDPSHCTLLKSDQFTIEMIDIIEVSPL